MSKNNSSFGRLNILKILAHGGGRIVFLGAGGVGMSSLMALTSHFGIKTQGFDRASSVYLDALKRSGEEVTVGDGELPSDTALLVYTLAISESDPLILSAELRKIPCVSRAEYMSAIVSAYKMKIAVSGSHGKSTVTAMLHSIFTEAGKNPTTVSGASLYNTGEAYRIGALDYILFESCEYKDSFLSFEPDMALFLNLEYDHTDYFKSFDDLCQSFAKAAQKSAISIINVDDGKLREIGEKLYTTPIKVGINQCADYRYEPISEFLPKIAARVYYGDRELGVLRLNILGQFNISNAVMATAAAMECGISFDVCASALSCFRGAPSRLEYVTRWQGREVYFDYAHHPTEISAGIKAIKDYTGGDITLIFGPHTYSRTKSLFDSFIDALSLADHLLLTPIDAIREEKDDTVSSEALASLAGGRVVYTVKEVVSALSQTKGTIVVMGAADLSWVKSIFL